MGEAYDDSLRAFLEQSGVSDRVLEIIKGRGLLNKVDFFTRPISTLVRITGVGYNTWKHILELTSSSILPRPRPLSKSDFKQWFKDPILDENFPIPNSGIVEIAGLSSSGKTNVVSYLATVAAHENPDKKVIIINTESALPTKRIAQMSVSPRIRSDPSVILSRILIKKVETVEELCEIVEGPLRTLCASSPPSLIAIDSIAAPFRVEYDMTHIAERAQVFFSLATTLKWISHLYDIPVLVTNQATADVDQFHFGSKDWKPALGYSWSYCVNVRLILTKTSMKRDVDIDPSEVVVSGPRQVRQPVQAKTVALRTIYSDISPIKQGNKATFYIDDNGIHGM